MSKDEQTANLRQATADAVNAIDPPAAELDIIERTAELPDATVTITGHYDPLDITAATPGDYWPNEGADNG